MTHFCSSKVTHTWNTICPRARPVCHCGPSTSSTPQACRSLLRHLFLRKDLRSRSRQTRPARPHLPQTAIYRLPAGKLHQAGAVVGQFWAAYPGHFPRVPKNATRSAKFSPPSPDCPPSQSHPKTPTECWRDLGSLLTRKNDEPGDSLYGAFCQTGTD